MPVDRSSHLTYTERDLMQASHAPSNTRRAWQGAEPRCIPKVSYSVKVMNPRPIMRRRYRISFRVTAPERQQLDAAAEGRRATLSDYARSILLGVPPRPGARRPRADTALFAR